MKMSKGLSGPRRAGLACTKSDFAARPWPSMGLRMGSACSAPMSSVLRQQCVGGQFAISGTVEVPAVSTIMSTTARLPPGRR